MLRPIHVLQGYVDFIILPLFGLVNAGVDCTTIGPFSAVIWLSATVGKTIGIGVTAWLLQRWGYHPPKGMTTRSLFLVGYLASVGLYGNFDIIFAPFPALCPPPPPPRANALCYLPYSVLDAERVLIGC